MSSWGLGRGDQVVEHTGRGVFHVAAECWVSRATETSLGEENTDQLPPAQAPTGTKPATQECALRGN